MDIIPAEAKHLPAIQQIYAWHVLHGTGSFESEPPTEAEMAGRLKKIQQAGLIWLVAIEGVDVKGYCYLMPYRPRFAYRFTLENAVYVDPTFQQRGAGRALLDRAIAWATEHGYRQLIANVGDSENRGSLGLHQAAGFSVMGTLHAVGFKHGRWLDTVLMQRPLGENSETLPAINSAPSS